MIAKQPCWAEGGVQGVSSVYSGPVCRKDFTLTLTLTLSLKGEGNL